MSVQTLLAEEEAVALGALDVSRTVAFIRFSMILAAFLETSSAMVDLIVGAGVLARRVVGSETMGTEVTFTKKTL